MTSKLVGVVPRWEWRTFGERFGGAEEQLTALTPDSVKESDEMYLLSLESDASVKVRDGLLDVKRLEQVDADGLEQWRPVMKAEFPLAAGDVASVLAALGIEGANLAREAYTLDQLLDDVVDRSDVLRAVDVHKHRRRYALGGCMAELTDVRAGSHSTRTIAIESDRSGARRRDSARPGLHGAAERQLRTRAQAARRLRGCPVRRDRRRHELGQVPRR